MSGAGKKAVAVRIEIEYHFQYGGAEPVIVCVCKGVNEREIRDTITAGCRTEETIGTRCGAGTDCGSCLETLRELLQAGQDHHGPSKAHLALAPRASVM
jgi:bacterioferritin-associated ferredoxin